MNIAYLSNSIIPSTNANSVQVMNTCGALQIIGNRVELFARYPLSEKDSDQDYINRFYGIEEPFSIIHFSWPNIRAIGGIYYSNMIHKYFKKNTLPDLFYGRDSNSLLRLTRFGVPLYLESHTIPEGKYKTNKIEKLLRCKYFRGLIVTSQALKESYLKLYPFLKETDIFIVRNAASIPIRPLSKSAALVSERFKVGYVGSLREGKGIEIITALSKKMPNIEFHVVGGTAAQIEKIRHEYDNKNLYFHGFVKNASLSKYYSTFDILLAPYPDIKIKNNNNNAGILTDKWASPLKITEYMSYRKPIIASDLPMIREILSNNSNSLLCNPSNIEDWVSSINLLEKNRSLYEKLASNAYNEFISYYTWDSRAKNLMEIFMRGTLTS